jgi:hypothetical protein
MQDAQIKLALTKDEPVLAHLRRTGKLVQKAGSKFEHYEVMFNGQPIEFKLEPATGRRSVHPFGADVAKSLVRDSLVIVGDFNSAPLQTLVEVARFSLTEGDPMGDKQQMHTCPFCKRNAPTLKALGEHIAECPEAIAKVITPPPPPPVVVELTPADEADESEKPEPPAPPADIVPVPSVPSSGSKPNAGVGKSK